MRNQFNMLAGLAAMAASIASFGASAASAAGSIATAGDDLRISRRHKGKGKNFRRGRGKVTPPKKRSNRLVVSKRVRRKHRRAGR